MSYAYIAHTMLRVVDLDASIAFYTQTLGMDLKRREEYPQGEFTLAFVGFADAQIEIELTHNWAQKEPYDLGNGFGHICISVEDIYSAFEAFKQQGVTIVREAGPMNAGGKYHIGFIKDPDGYMIEYVQAVNS